MGQCWPVPFLVNGPATSTIVMSSFGQYFRVHTFGESHCLGVGCIVDGVPPRIPLTEDDIQVQLTRRRPERSHRSTGMCGANVRTRTRTRTRARWLMSRRCIGSAITPHSSRPVCAVDQARREGSCFHPVGNGAWDHPWQPDFPLREERGPAAWRLSIHERHPAPVACRLHLPREVRLAVVERRWPLQCSRDHRTRRCRRDR